MKYVLDGQTRVQLQCDFTGNHNMFPIFMRSSHWLFFKLKKSSLLLGLWELVFISWNIVKKVIKWCNLCVPHSPPFPYSNLKPHYTQGWRNLGHSVMFIQNWFIRDSQMVHWWMMGHIIGKALLVMVGWEAVPSTGNWFHQVLFSLIFLQPWFHSQVDLVGPKVDPTDLVS
jgi:hypothetical protein